MIYRVIIKPFFDRVTALLLLMLLFPAFVIVSILLFTTQQGKVFFTQSRPGLNGKPFRLIKFKTMNDKKDNDGNLLPDMMRMHNTGKFLRKTSLDEIPQLLNVVMGDMSFVGPRPLLMEYLPLYNPEQKKRHLVKPGITGWAQVNGRNSLSWQKKFELDVWYVEHQSFMLDLKILAMTAGKIFRSSDVNASSADTMPPFTGNN